MSSQWQIFVEGPEDRAFLKGLLQHLNISNVNMSIIGGGVAKLPNIANEIQRAYCEALGLETRASRRKYVNSSYWNLDAPDLEPLKTFLRAL